METYGIDLSKQVKFMNLTLQQCNKVVELLNEILTSGPKSRGLGVCHNMEDLLHQYRMESSVIGHVYKANDHFAKKWNKYSGNSSFPVPAPEHIGGGPTGAYRAFKAGVPKWDGKYGELRKEYIKMLMDSYSKVARTIEDFERRLAVLKDMSMACRVMLRNGKPFIPKNALCYNIDYALKEAERLDLCGLKREYLHEFFKSWQHFSGNVTFPVPDTGKFEGYDEPWDEAYMHACKKDQLWDRRTKYGKLRWILTEHVEKCASRAVVELFESLPDRGLTYES